MNSRAYQFQLQAAEAAAVEAPPVHVGDDSHEQEPPQLELEVQGAADAPPVPHQGNGVAQMGVDNAEATKYYCPECPKWFPSEKAVFGHLRKHPERGYKGAIRPATAGAGAAPAAAIAVAADKKPTKKQVARKVADVSAMNTTAPAVTAGEKKPAELSTTKWPITAKRGRAPFATSGSGERALEAGMQASSEHDDHEAAMILLDMASSTRSASEKQQGSVQQVHAPDAVSAHQMLGVEQPMVAVHQTPEAEKTVQPEIALEGSGESQTPPAVKELTNLEITTQATVLIVVPANKPAIVPSPGSSTVAKKGKKRRALDVVEQVASSPAPPEGADGSPPPVWRIPSPASNKKHDCHVCNKSFPTYQALGGHMSSHGKAKASARDDELAVAAQAVENILAHGHHSGANFITAGYGAGAGVGNFIAGSSGAIAGMGLLLQAGVQLPPPTMVAQSAPAHVCAECHMTFPSGQALGGHKRKHWFPEKYQAAKAAMAEPAPAPAPALVARDFDLNELPEEGEGEIE